MHMILKYLPSQLECKFHEDRKFVLLAAGNPEARTKPDNLTHIGPSINISCYVVFWQTIFSFKINIINVFEIQLLLYLRINI